MCIVYISAIVHSIHVFSNKYYKIYQAISIHGLIFLYASYWYWTILAIVGAKSVFPVWPLEGQIERKCQNRISKGNSELTGTQWVPSRAVLAYVCPKRPNMGQIGPRDIGADLDFGDEHYTFRVEKGEGGKPALTLAPNLKRQTVQSIDQWVSAFQVFVAIYSEKVPQDTPALMKYGSIIRELATLGANWKFYDENFRSIRQTQGAPWDQIHAELWLRSHSFRAKLSPQAGKSKQTGQRIPKGFCWRYHKGVTCSGCSFKHQCFRCGNNHLISKCQQSYSKPPAGNSGTKPTGANYATSNRSPTNRITPNPGQG